jgi:hypothetical protein
MVGEREGFRKPLSLHIPWPRGKSNYLWKFVRERVNGNSIYDLCRFLLFVVDLIMVHCRMHVWESGSCSIYYYVV